MATDDQLTLAVIKTMTVIFGAAFFTVAVRALMKHRSRNIFYLATAVAVLTLGVVVEFMLLTFAGWAGSDARIAEAFITLAGFGVLVYSLYA